MPCLSRTIAHIAPHLPETLVSAEAGRRVRGVTDLIPAALTRWVYLECRLASAAPQVDVILSVEEVGRRLLEQAGAGGLPPELAADPLWRRVCAYCALWGAPGTALDDVVERMWLEFDADDRARDAGHRVPVPGVFVDLTPDAYTSGTRGAQAECAVRALRPLVGDGLPDQTVRELRACYAALPADACVVYVGYLPARGSSEVRLCIRTSDDADLLRMLAAVGWRDADGALPELMARLASARGTGADAPPAGVSIAHLDIDERGVLPQIGLEYAFRRAPQIRGALAETAFLDTLVDLGLCAPAKREALEAWPGVATGVLEHEFWATTWVRRLNHVKVVYAPGRGAVAKAYPCLFNKLRAVVHRRVRAERQPAGALA